jgi:hypothetical protein
MTSNRIFPDLHSRSGMTGTRKFKFPKNLKKRFLRPHTVYEPGFQDRGASWHAWGINSLPFQGLDKQIWFSLPFPDFQTPWDSGRPGGGPGQKNYLSFISTQRPKNQPPGQIQGWSCTRTLNYNLLILKSNLLIHCKFIMFGVVLSSIKCGSRMTHLCLKGKWCTAPQWSPQILS